MVSMTDVDYYEILDVRPTATAAEIKAAYHRAVRSAHPDAGGTAGMFRLVTDAYRTLSDPQARAAYDAGAGRPRPGRPGPGEPGPDTAPAPEPSWGDEVRWEAGGTAEPGRAGRAAETASDHAEHGPTWSERWVRTPRGLAAVRWGGWVTAGLFVLLTAVLFLLPEWVRPAAAGGDVLGSLLDHRAVLTIVVVVYAVAAIFGFLGLLWLPVTLLHVGVLVLVVLGWPLAYWGLAETWERVAFAGVAVVWIVYAAAMTAVPLWQSARFRLDQAT